MSNPTELKPKWASEWGDDLIGKWVTFRVGDVTQHLRWIPPGKFLMGTPDHEADHWNYENPQHEAIIEQGFWMFDTPCTQALWMAVMGENPSWFCGPTRPVEQVSWNDVQDFLDRMRWLVPGLHLNLPTEEQWEYACRAGSTEPRYGNLNRIAWYDENSDSETHPVGLKKPNDWGLYDMLGNVWELCSSVWVKDYNEKPHVPMSNSDVAPRVIRGGSWSYGKVLARAATRICYIPPSPDMDLGFRCVVSTNSS